MRARSKLLVMTRSAKGCIVFKGDTVLDVPAPQVQEVNATGAGDTFATAFFVQMQRTKGDVRRSAEFANLIASTSVAQIDLVAKIKAINAIMAQTDY